MPAAETSNIYRPDFLLTSDIIDGLEEVRRTNLSSHYTHPDLPHIYVRTSINHFSSDGIGDLRETYRQAYVNIEDAGFAVTPFSLVLQGARLYIFARKVEGQPLGKLLPDSPELTKQYDKITANQAADYWSLRGREAVYPADIFGHHQFMWGRLSGTRDAPSMIFVDVDESGGGFIKGTGIASNKDYAFYELVRIAAAVIDDENKLGISLPLARAELYRQLGHLSREAVGTEQHNLSLIRHALGTNNADLMDQG